MGVWVLGVRCRVEGSLGLPILECNILSSGTRAQSSVQASAVAASRAPHEMQELRDKEVMAGCRDVLCVKA